MSRRPVPIPPGGFRHIAVLRLSSLGDVVLALPVVHALRAAHPEARITFWVKEEYRDVVGFDPAVSHVRTLEKDARRIEDLVSMSAELEECDLIVDLHGSARTQLLTFRQKAPVLRAPSYRLRRERWVHARWSRPPAVPPVIERNAAALEPIGLPAPGPPRLSVGPDAERWAEAWMAEWGVGRPVAICPAARHPTKQWPEERWVGLHRALRAAGRGVVALSLTRERDVLPALAAAVEADPGSRWCTETLPRMGALLSRSALAVACDSGLMHLAAARGLGVVALFGSTSPVLGFAPSGQGHEVLCRNEPCQPCTLHGRERCPKGHFRCMRGLSVDDVLAGIDRRSGRAH